MRFKKLGALILGALLTIGVAAGIGATVEKDRVKATASEIVFNLGANGDASHSDGTSKTTYSETVSGYTLSLTNVSNFYTGARDAKGNSCIKLGASSKAGSFSLTAPDDVTSVIFAVGKYKSNTTKVSIEETAHTLTKNSNDGAYDEITVDIPSDKTISFTTVSGGWRAMLNTITYVIDSSGGSDERTLEEITVSGQQTEFTVGDEFVFGGTVTAIYSNGDEVDVTNESEFSGYDMSQAGTQTVTVSYEDKTTTFTINVKEKTSFLISATNTITLAPGMSEKIKTLIKKDEVETTDLSLSYSTSNPEVAEVDENGVVTAKSVGQTTVTITGENANSVDTNIIVSNEFTRTISYSSKDSSDHYDRLEGNVLTLNKEEGKSADDSFLNIFVNATNDAKLMTINKNSVLIIETKQNILITSIVFNFDAGVNAFESSLWENAQPSQNSSNENAVLELANPCSSVSLKAESLAEGYFTIDTIYVTVKYKAPILSADSVSIDTTNAKTSYNIFETLSLDNLKFVVTDNSTDLTYDYIYGDESIEVISNPAHGTTLTSHGTQVINIEFFMLGQKLTSSFEIDIKNNINLKTEENVMGWKMVTDASILKEGDQIIITAADEDFALSTTQNNNNRAATPITRNNSNNTLDSIENAQIITLETGTVSNTFGFYTGSGYLYAASSSGNQLKTQSTNNDNGSWDIAINQGIATLKASGSYTRNTMQYNPNNGSPIFSCYGSASQKQLKIYKYQSYNDIVEHIASDTVLNFISEIKFGETPLLDCETKTKNWNDIEIAFNKLDDNDKNLLKIATAVSKEDGGNILEDFLSDYDFIIEFYGYENFIGRVIENESHTNSFGSFDNNTSLIIILCAIVALSGFAFFYVAKRKNKEFEF